LSLREDLAASVRRHWAAVRGEIERHFAILWAEAELPNMERASAAALCGWLEAEDFQVERAACGLPTAFRASWRKGEGPRIGLLAEYDALPGTGNKAVPRRGRAANGPATLAATTKSVQLMSAPPLPRGGHGGNRRGG
jgi:aminobenzoyl-glutamate utilization protein B